ncbi:porin family protein [Vibrio breoganii]|uniref:porin family protein n=1 Tax=Vibrio breoganii TaxID=553239 RepID=UPI000C820756|nr:porin family protein [Vibrio breoganii]PMK47392.1 hypothetical protein BCU00_06250 [Vibrio breoganii]
MKIIRTVLLSSAFLSLPVLADEAIHSTVEANGHRVGIGFSTTHDVTYDDLKLGTGVKLEYGYEFNDIFGINVSYAGFSDSESDYGLTLDVDGSTLKLDTDIGYTFHFDSFAIKPYGAIGIVRHSEEWKFLGQKEKYDDTNVFIGIGARATIKNHYYTDIRFEGYATDYADYSQFSMTFGYRF